MNEIIYCPAEKAVLLASFQVQAKFMDYDDEIHASGYLANEKLMSEPSNGSDIPELGTTKATDHINHDLMKTKLKINKENNWIILTPFLAVSYTHLTLPTIYSV